MTTNKQTSAKQQNESRRLTDLFVFFRVSSGSDRIFTVPPLQFSNAGVCVCVCVWLRKLRREHQNITLKVHRLRSLYHQNTCRF